MIPPCFEGVDLMEGGGEHGDGDDYGDGEDADDVGHRLLPSIDTPTSCLVIHLKIIHRRHFFSLQKQDFSLDLILTNLIVYGLGWL